MSSRFLFAAALLAAVLAAPAFASTRAPELQIPKNDGWVTDLAGMLSPEQERELEELMERYKQGSTHEIALLTVPELKGEPIERFALDVGRAWGIGGKDKNNGALLVVSKADRAVRIEVGRGLEGNLTDSISGRIIRDVIVPRFRRGDFAGGLRQGIEAIHEAIGGKYGKLPKESVPVAVGLLGAIVPLFVLAFVIFLIVISRTRHGWRRRPGLFPGMFIPPISGGRGFGGGRSSGGGFGGFSGFGGGGGFSGGGASGRW